ncbi:MAG TPA: hypothetical protein VHY36_05660 [Steroidobacteraceae bacterium]|nr:hypothetical protein [Steroidobacteraceae bacterium]
MTFITVLLLGCSLATARPPDACSLTSTVTDAKLTLSIPDGRTSFREGEIVPLVLSFTSTAHKRYSAVVRNYDRSGRLDLETYCLEPKARDPLADYFSTTFSLGGGLGGEQQLSEKPFIVTVELNEWRQPGPGDYRLYVVSPRVSGEPTSLNSLRGGGTMVVLRSNTIEFDVIKTKADSRAKQSQAIVAAYQHATAEPCDYGFPHECAAEQAARQLRFLNTKESTEALARLFWSLDEQPGGWDLMFGLFGSSYRAEAIAAMRHEINSPDHPITQDFLMVLTKLQLLQTAREVPKEPPMDDPEALRQFAERLRKIEAHEPEVRKAALTATVAALPHKTGRAHALTLVTLATERSDLLDKETAAQMRRQLIAEWGSLPEKTRADLIRNGWPPLDGTEALPILREIASQAPPHFGNAGSFACYALTQAQCSVVMSRNKALKRIFELNPAEGRSLILRDLSDPEAQPSLSLVKLLPSAQLRPFVQRAVQRISTNDARPWDYTFVGLFADKSALGPLEAKFKEDTDRLTRGMCLPYAVPMLRYFLRVDPKVGAREVQAQLVARKVTGCYPTLLEDLGASLPPVEQLAISNLDDADVEVAGSAARALGRWGTPKAESALWARLARFHQEWPTGVGELRLTDKDTSARVRALDNLETTLVYAIVSGTNWICGPEKLRRLRAITSRQQGIAISQWINQWEGTEGPWILNPFWGPEDQLTFSVLQYSQLDEEQIRVKLAQIPRGSQLYFQTYTAEQMGSPVSMEKQQAVLQGLRKYAAQFGVIVEERPR